MPAPTVEKAREASAKVNALGPAEYDRRKRQEAGDALIAFFAILAKKLFPGDPEAATARRVQLMLAAYLFRGDVEGHMVRAPDEATAKRAADAVASLGGAELENRIDDEVGNAVLSWFGAFCDRFAPERSADARAGNVHLMVLAYLIRGELGRRC